MAGSDSTHCEIGVIGLDAAGCGVALNLAHHGFQVAACEWEPRPALAPFATAAGPAVRLAAGPRELIAGLRQPRTILTFSGAPAQSAIEEPLPGLKSGDLLMDAGNSHFKDTARRARLLAEQGIQFIGLGLAGGQEGPRQGAIVMAGGGEEARQRARPLLEAIAARVRGEPCVCLLETAAAAHFAKMVHAGIEYALLQLLSECFDLLQRALLLTDDELHDASGAFHLGVLNGYLMEVSGRVFEQADQHRPQLLLEEKLAAAKSNVLGTMDHAERR